jgi:hypothetical protein
MTHAPHSYATLRELWLDLVADLETHDAPNSPATQERIKELGAAIIGLGGPNDGMWATYDPATGTCAGACDCSIGQTCKAYLVYRTKQAGPSDGESIAVNRDTTCPMTINSTVGNCVDLVSGRHVAPGCSICASHATSGSKS